MSAEGDILNPLIVVVTFLGITVLFIGIVMAESPSLFVDPEEEYRDVQVPDHFEAIDLLYYTDFANFTMYDGMLYYAFDLGGWHFEMFTNTNFEDTEIWIMRGKRWWLFSWAWHHLYYDSRTGRDVSTYSYESPYLACSTIDEYYKSSENASSFICYDDEMRFIAWFSYNQDTYNNCSDALKNDDLNFLGAIEFDQQNTGMNVFSMIGMLLFFRIPNMHPLINVIIALPMWISIMWIVTVIVLAFIKSLPFT